ncbi:MAG: ATP-binding cassette domain-containing protein, partial [Brooklawnia sp.]
MGRVELQRLTKRYGALLANDAIDLTLNPGEIHALLGANGAGKTTLVNILAGTLPATSGQVLVPGRLRVVHQHFRLVETFTVAENIMLGREPGPGFILDGRRGRALAREAAERFGLDLDPDAVVADLPVGARQRVEVVKALVDDADWLVLDEPTAVLRPAEIDHLMGVLDRLRKAGRGILLITHKLAEATAIADRITVLRQGRVVAEVAPDIPHSEL